MNISIRDTTEADLPDIFRIRTDPLVRPHQYTLSRWDTVDMWKRLLFDGRPYWGARYGCTSILDDGKVIGHISQIRHELGRRSCYCGWNLAPTHWGRGIAVIALSELFVSLFSDDRVDVVISDCFEGNERCLRVLHKLNYAPAPIRFHERMVIRYLQRCRHTICRFQLPAYKWYRQLLARSAR
jgi:RimJ/RimL family protein N-acetyltransferase